MSSAMLKSCDIEANLTSQAAASVGKEIISLPMQSENKPSKVEAMDSSKPSVIPAVVLYGFCSSSLLVINKIAMWMLPDASFILFCQFLASSLAVRILKVARPDMDIELLKWEKAKPFLVATAVFYMCLLANTKALQSVNVETVIVVRSCSPIAVTILEHLTLGRELPSLKGLAALLSIAGGAAVYVLADKGFQVQGYIWVSVYFVFIVIEMVYVKFVVDTVPMSTWTRVYYNNTLSLPMAVLSTLVLGDSKFLHHQWHPTTVVAIGLSCVVGVAISYAGFNLRKSVSATSFTVVGVVCKLLTVLMNDVIWSFHANALGHCGLLMCIVAGFWFERVKAEDRARREAAMSKLPLS